MKEWEGALALGAHGSIVAKRLAAWQWTSKLPASLCFGNSSSAQSCGARMCVTLRQKHLGSPRGYPLTTRGLGWVSGGRNRGAQWGPVDRSLDVPAGSWVH